MTKLRISPDGTVRGLWSDAVDWPALGPVAVERASHVEFDARRQQWFVRESKPRSRWRRILQQLTGRAFGAILYRARSREQALAWEREHFEPGGPGWRTRKQW